MTTWTKPLRRRPPPSHDRPVKTASLRHRVVFGVLALMLALLIGLGLVVNAVLRDRLESDLHQRLRERAGLAQALAGQGLSDQALGDRLTGAGITASVSSGNGVVVGRDQPPLTSPGGRPERGQHGPRPRAPAAATVEVTQDGPRLSVEVIVDDRTVTMTTSTVEIDRTLATLQRIELAAGGATLVLLAFLLWRVVGAALSPLDRMTGLARRISDGVRGRRLRPTRPGTELGRTAVAFDAMLDSLENAEALAQGAEARMRQFLADASHDLRTPITGVITTAERVLRENPDRPVREERLVELIREAQRASRLVDDLLLMARLDAQEPPRARLVDVGRLVRTAIERAQRQDVTVRFIVAAPPAGPIAAVEVDALHRILANLLDNARHAGGAGAGGASAAGATITVRVSITNGFAAIDVHDDGPGVAPADRERIFERFVRLDASRQHWRRSSGGTGLGLPIARALARWQGGDLIYLEEPGGATMRISLPAVPERVGPPGHGAWLVDAAHLSDVAASPASRPDPRPTCSGPAPDVDVVAKR